MLLSNCANQPERFTALMKFGLGEIILILLAIFVVTLVVRIMKMREMSARAKRYRQREMEEDEEEYDDQPRKPVQRRFVVIGSAVILLGVVILLSSLNLLKWIILAPVTAALALIAGSIIIIMAFRRR